VDQTQLQNVIAGSQLLNLLDLFSGGGLARLSVVALGVNPYINASIIMTLLNQTIPALENLSKEGEYGRNKINQYTRVLTVPLALLQGIGVAVFMQRSNVIPEFGPANLGLTLAILSSLVAGTLILMWLGELISERGIGNGISFIIFAGIVGRMPTTGSRTSHRASWPPSAIRSSTTASTSSSSSSSRSSTPRSRSSRTTLPITSSGTAGSSRASGRGARPRTSSSAS